MREILFRGQDKSGKWHYGHIHIDSIKAEDRYYINSKISVDDPEFVEVIKETTGQVTDSLDINGDSIFEGDYVYQRSVLLGDNENIDFSGYVKFLEGRWVIDNGKNATPLWSEHRENKVIK